MSSEFVHFEVLRRIECLHKATMMRRLCNVPQCWQSNSKQGTKQQVISCTLDWKNVS